MGKTKQFFQDLPNDSFGQLSSQEYIGSENLTRFLNTDDLNGSPITLKGLNEGYWGTITFKKNLLSADVPDVRKGRLGKFSIISYCIANGKARHLEYIKSNAPELFKKVSPLDRRALLIAIGRHDNNMVQAFFSNYEKEEILSFIKENNYQMIITAAVTGNKDILIDFLAMLTEDSLIELFTTDNAALFNKALANGEMDILDILYETFDSIQEKGEFKTIDHLLKTDHFKFLARRLSQDETKSNKVFDALNQRFKTEPWTHHDVFLIIQSAYKQKENMGHYATVLKRFYMHNPFLIQNMSPQHKKQIKQYGEKPLYTTEEQKRIRNILEFRRPLISAQTLRAKRSHTEAEKKSLDSSCRLSAP